MTGRPTRRDLMRGALALGLGAPLAAGLPAAAEETATPPADPTAGRALVFEDGFARLDPERWNRGPKATTNDSGQYGRAAFAPEGGAAGVSPYDIVADAEAEDGTALEITARYVGRPLGIEGYHGNDDPEYQWVSGNVQGATKEGTILLGWPDGYFEARIHMPRHPLTWGAFWLLNGRSILHPKTSVEIDAVEHKGWELQLYGTYLHEWGEPGEHHEGSGAETPVDVTTGYFRYGVLVEPEGFVTPYFERAPVRSPQTGEPLRWRIGRMAELQSEGDVFWPLLTLALRSDIPYPASLSPEELSARMRVDYLRVYR